VDLDSVWIRTGIQRIRIGSGFKASELDPDRPNIKEFTFLKVFYIYLFKEWFLTELRINGVK
jgi:hypothetical protein